MDYAHSEDDFATSIDTIVTTRGIAAQTKCKDGAVGVYLVRLFLVLETVERNFSNYK